MGCSYSFPALDPHAQQSVLGSGQPLHQYACQGHAVTVQGSTLYMLYPYGNSASRLHAALQHSLLNLLDMSLISLDCEQVGRHYY